MAIFATRTLLSYLIFILISAPLIPISGSSSYEQFAETKPADLANNMSHLHFYFHEIVSGRHPTAVRVGGPKNAFGTTVIIDDPLTEGPEHGSKLVGRAEGMYAVASQHNGGLLMAINFAFTEGRFNGSTLSILGRNQVLDVVREMPVLGGSGVFRFARGYALARTVRYNQKTGDAVNEYDVYVLHQ